MVKLGAGELTMNARGNNSYSGGTWIKVGALVVDADSDLGAASGGLALGTNTIAGTNTNGTLKFAAGFDLAASRAVTLLDGGGTIDTQSYNTSLSQNITGTGSLTKTGTGALTLSGTNSYQGNTIVQQGTLGVNSDAALGAASGRLVLEDQTTLRLDGDLDSARRVTLGGSPNRRMTIDTQGHSGRFSGMVDGNGALVKAGGGTLILAGTANNYGGGTYIQAGTLAIAADGSLGQGMTVTMNDQSTLRLDNDLSSNRDLNLDGPAGSRMTIDTQSHSGGWTGLISGAGTLVKAGSGALNLSGGNNSYSGGTVISQGSVLVDADANLGAAAGSLTMNNQTALRLTADASSARQINLDGPAGSQMSIDTQNNTGTFSGQISGGGALVKEGGGILVLSGANSYSGGSIVKAGTLAVNSNAALGADSGALTLNDQTTLRLDGDLSSDGRPIILSGSPGSRMTIDTRSHNGVFGGNVSGAGTLVIDNSNGTQDGLAALYGTSDYSGGTVLKRGTLAVNSDQALGAADSTLELYNQTTLRLDGDTVMSSRPVLIGNIAEDASTPNSVTINTNGFSGRIDSAVSSSANTSTPVRLDKTGSGVLALYGANSYDGGTWVRQGTVAIKDIGGLGGGHLFLGDGGGSPANPGTLRLDADVDFTSGWGSTGRHIYLNSGGGIFDNQGFSSTVAEDSFRDGSTADPAYGAGGGAGFLGKQGTGVLTVLGNQEYSGDTYVEAGTFRLDAVDPGNPSVNSRGLTRTASMNVSAGARLEGQGLVGRAGALTTNSGTISPGLARFARRFDSTDPAFISLTLNGNYTATPGAVVEINTQLANDHSRHGTLIINGVVEDSSAVTGVRVIHHGGNGATTQRGIEIIRILGDSDHAAQGRKFQLISDFSTRDGRSAVIAGAYSYLMQDDVDYGNSVNPSLTSGIYLRNAIDSSGNLILHPGTPLYESYPLILGGLNRLPTLEQRLGHRLWLEDSGGGQRQPDRRAAWLRLEGSTGHYKPKLDSCRNVSYDLDFGRLNFGLDLPVYDSEAGSRLMLGLNLNLGLGSADIDAFQGKGSIDARNEGLGATLTWFGRSGFYADAQARFNWFDSDISSDTIHSASKQIEGNDARGRAFSLEIGRIFNLNDHWSLTPQAQLMYSRTSFESFVDAQNSLVVDEKDYQNLEGRFGLALNYENSYQGESGQLKRNKFYGLANVYHEFKGDAAVSISGVKYDSKLNDTWLGLALGGSHNWADDSFSLYGEVGARSSSKEFGSEYELTGELGFRLAF